MCDTFAAELLMPYLAWRAKVPQKEPSVEVLEYMASEFRTSFPAAASRYATLSDMPCSFVTMDRGQIRYAARSTSLRRVGAWITPRSPIPLGSVAYRLRQAGLSNWKPMMSPRMFGSKTGTKDSTCENLPVTTHEPTRRSLCFGSTKMTCPKSSKTASMLENQAMQVLFELTGQLPWPSGKRRR